MSAPPSPHNWIGAYRAALNGVVATSYGADAQASALAHLRRAYDIDHGLGAGWDQALIQSARAGFAAGVGFMLDNDFDHPPKLLAKLREVVRQTGGESFMWLAHGAREFMISSPDRCHPPSVPTAIAKANHEIMVRLHASNHMPVAGWNEISDLAAHGNTALACSLVRDGRVELLSSPRATKDMLRLLASHTIGRFNIAAMATALHSPSHVPLTDLAQAIFSTWWSQAPGMSRHGDQACVAILKMVRRALAPEALQPMSVPAGRRHLWSALQLIDRCGYPARQVFRVAARELRPSLASIAITQNEPETLEWLVDQGIDLSGENFLVNHSCHAGRRAVKNSFCQAIVSRLEVTTRDDGLFPDRPRQADKWWDCIARLMQVPHAQSTLRANLRNRKVIFQAQDIQQRWDAAVGHATLQRTVAQIPEPAGPVPTPRPSRF